MFGPKLFSIGGFEYTAGDALIDGGLVVAGFFSGGIGWGALAGRHALMTGGKMAARALLKEGAEQVAKQGVKKAARKVATEAAEETAETAAKKTVVEAVDRTARRRLNLGLAVAVMPATVAVAYKAGDYAAGGALSGWLVENAVKNVKEAVQDGRVTRETLEDIVDNAATVAEVMDLTKGKVESAVRLAMGYTENPTAEDYRRGKMAAVACQLQPDKIMTTALKHAARQAAVDDLYPDRDEADRYLARKFMEDIIESTDVDSLKDHPVTEEDVVAAIRDHAGISRTLLPERLEHGLKLLHPDIFPEQTPEPEAKKKPTPAQTQAGSSWLSDSENDEGGPDLVSIFTQKARTMAEKTGQSLGWQFNLMAGLTMFVNFINGLTGGMLDGVAHSLNKAMIDMAKTRVQEMTRGETVSTGTLNMDGRTPAPEPLRPSGQVPDLAPQ